MATIIGMPGARTLAQVYRHFGEVDAAGTSPLYERVAVAVSESGEALRAIEAAPARKRHPTVILTALHDLALAGRAPALAAAYAAADGDAAAGAAIDIEIEPSRTAHVNQPDRIRPRPARCLGNGRIQHGAVPGLVSPRPPAHGDGHDRVGHFQQRVDRRDSGSVAVRRGIRRGERRGAPREGEVVQRGEDHRGVPLARRRHLDGAQRRAGLTHSDGDALVQRGCSGGVDLTEAPVHLSERAGPAHGYGASCAQPWHPGNSSHRNDNPDPSPGTTAPGTSPAYPPALPLPDRSASWLDVCCPKIDSKRPTMRAPLWFGGAR